MKKGLFRDLIVGVVFFIFGILVLVFGLYLCSDFGEFKSWTGRTTGVVVGMRELQGKSFENVVYTVDEVEYSTFGNVYNDLYSEKREVVVVYNENSPDESFVRKSAVRRVNLLVVLVGFVLFAVGCLYLEKNAQSSDVFLVHEKEM